MALGSEGVNTLSFDFVFTNYYSYVSRLARGLLGNAQDAEDVTQDVFLRVYKSLSSYSAEKGTLNTWLGKMTVNTCRTHRRRSFFQRMLKSSLPDEDANEAAEPVDPSLFGAPEDRALHLELQETVRDILKKLRPEHRTVMVLYHFMDLSCTEIAAIVDCPEGTVYSRLYYARRIVQAQIEGHMRLTNSEVGL